MLTPGRLKKAERGFDTYIARVKQRGNVKQRDWLRTGAWLIKGHGIGIGMLSNSHHRNLYSVRGDRAGKIEHYVMLRATVTCWVE